MLKKTLGVIIFAILLVLGWYFWGYKFDFVSPKGRKISSFELALTKYDFDELRKRDKSKSKLEILGTIKEVEDRRKNCIGKTCMKAADFNFETKQISFESEGKKITGMINVPMTPNSRPMPAIIMVRGYADTAGYYSGSGTWRVADRLANAGFVTVSLDFLGYAQSDWPSVDILEARFEKVPAVLDLIESVKMLDYVDDNKIGIWAHSNGGQIVLSVLEVSGANYPTVLWAPMTDPFPQSVLNTINDDEPGRVVKAKIEEFGKQYDFRRYAFENYYDWIKAPVLIHQGTADEWCEVKWQRDVVEGIKAAGGEAQLDVLAGDDHNLSKNWLEVVERDVVFYKNRLMK